MEYAILVVVVIMALIGAQAYIKRAVEGRMRESSDDIGGQYSFELSTSNYTTTTHSDINEQTDAYTTNRRYDSFWSSRTGFEDVGNLSEEYGPM